MCLACTGLWLEKEKRKSLSNDVNIFTIFMHLSSITKGEMEEMREAEGQSRDTERVKYCKENVTSWQAHGLELVMPLRHGKLEFLIKESQ